jgi:hypothetical protein
MHDNDLCQNDNRVQFQLGMINENTVNEICMLIEEKLPPLPPRKKNRPNGPQQRAEVILKALRQYRNHM